MTLISASTQMMARAMLMKSEALGRFEASSSLCMSRRDHPLDQHRNDHRNSQRHALVEPAARVYAQKMLHPRLPTTSNLFLCVRINQRSLLKLMRTHKSLQPAYPSILTSGAKPLRSFLVLPVRVNLTSMVPRDGEHLAGAEGLVETESPGEKDAARGARARARARA